MPTFGSGEYRYTVVEGWEQLPDGWAHPDVAGVATDAQDRVYLFTRDPPRVIVYDRDGAVHEILGREEFHAPAAARHHDRPGRRGLVRRRWRPHRQEVHAGRRALLTIGTAGQPVRHRLRSAPSQASPARPCSSRSRAGRPSTARPTWRSARTATSTSPTATATLGSTASRRTASCSTPGASPGTGPGQFNLPHGIAVHRRRPGLRGRPRERPHPDLQPGRRLPDRVDRHASARPSFMIAPDGVVYVVRALAAGRRGLRSGTAGARSTRPVG